MRPPRSRSLRVTGVRQGRQRTATARRLLGGGGGRRAFVTSERLLARSGSVFQQQTSRASTRSSPGSPIRQSRGPRARRTIPRGTVPSILSIRSSRAPTLHVSIWNTSQRGACTLLRLHALNTTHHTLITNKLRAPRLPVCPTRTWPPRGRHPRRATATRRTRGLPGSRRARRARRGIGRCRRAAPPSSASRRRRTRGRAADTRRSAARTPTRGP